MHAGATHFVLASAFFAFSAEAARRPPRLSEVTNCKFCLAKCHELKVFDDDANYAVCLRTCGTNNAAHPECRNPGPRRFRR